jgi:hypothetical protein
VLLSQRKQEKGQMIVLYKATLYGVLALSAVALIAETLPEMEAKMFVIPALLLAMTICVIDLFRMNRVTTATQEEY